MLAELGLNALEVVVLDKEGRNYHPCHAFCRAMVRKLGLAYTKLSGGRLDNLR